MAAPLDRPTSSLIAGRRRRINYDRFSHVGHPFQSKSTGRTLNDTTLGHPNLFTNLRKFTHRVTLPPA